MAFLMRRVANLNPHARRGALVVSRIHLSEKDRTVSIIHRMQCGDSHVPFFLTAFLSAPGLNSLFQKELFFASTNSNISSRSN